MLACEMLLPNIPEKASSEPKLTLRARNLQELTLRSPNFRVLRVATVRVPLLFAVAGGISLAGQTIIAQSLYEILYKTCSKLRKNSDSKSLIKIRSLCTPLQRIHRSSLPSCIFLLGGRSAPGPPPSSSPKKFRKHSSNDSLIKICILCTSPIINSLQ